MHHWYGGAPLLAVYYDAGNVRSGQLLDIPSSGFGFPILSTSANHNEYNIVFESDQNTLPEYSTHGIGAWSAENPFGSVSTFPPCARSGFESAFCFPLAQTAEADSCNLAGQPGWDGDHLSSYIEPLPTSGQPFEFSYTTGGHEESTSNGLSFLRTQSVPLAQSVMVPTTDQQGFGTTPIIPHLAPDVIVNPQFGGQVNLQTLLPGPLLESGPGTNHFHDRSSVTLTDTLQVVASTVPRSQQPHTDHVPQALGSNDTRPSAQRDPVSTEMQPGAGRILCPIEGCTQSCRRPADFRRHLREHSAEKRQCPVEGCQRMFSTNRRDKLKEHLRKQHSVDSETVNRLCSVWES